MKLAKIIATLSIITLSVSAQASADFSPVEQVPQSPEAVAAGVTISPEIRQGVKLKSADRAVELDGKIFFYSSAIRDEKLMAAASSFVA